MALTKDQIIDMLKDSSPQDWNQNKAALQSQFAGGEIDLSGAQLAGAELGRKDLRRVILRDAQLDGANLFRADLSDADLRGAHLQRADLTNAVLDGAKCQGVDFQDAVLTGVNLGKAYTDPTTRLEGAVQDKGRAPRGIKELVEAGRQGTGTVDRAKGRSHLNR